MTEEELRDLFREIDVDGSGYVDEEEVAALAKRLGAPLTKRELAEAMKEVRRSAPDHIHISPLDLAPAGRR